METIRVLLCHQHPLVRSGLRALLEQQANIRVAGEAANGQEALALAVYCSPHVVVLDVKLAQITGIAAARAIIRKVKNAAIIFVSIDADPEYVAEAFKAGARGYVVADAAPSDLIQAIIAVAQGRRYLSRSITSQLLKDYSRMHPKSEALTETDEGLQSLLAEDCYDDDMRVDGET
jgi:DNA-binding NarL/FixJ family response regulator